MRVVVALALVCLVIVSSSLVALAATRRTPEDLGLVFDTAVKEDAPAALVLRPKAGIKAATFTITGPGGVPQVRALGALRAGGSQRVRLEHGEGKASYRGTLEVRWADGQEGMYTFEFEAVRFRALKMSMAWEDIDLERRVATCRATREVERVEVVVEASDGRVLAEASQSFDPPAPGGSELSVGWEAPEGGEAAARITVKVTDPLGVWASMKATPFTISIPHDEVEFALGEAVIRGDEAAKLEKTLDELRRALKAHGTLLDLKLFIAGFTDTVGPSGANVALSLRRAAAIAAWFRVQGVRVPIYYRGFGEGALAVTTPDETDEPRNRRALYILSVHPPLGVRVAGAQGDAVDAAAGWRRL